MGVLPFLQTFIIPLSVFPAAALGGPYVYITPALALLVHPILDIVTPVSHRIETPRHLLYSFPLWLHAPLQAIVIVYCLNHLSVHSSWLSLVAFSMCLGVSTGAMGITVAHELIHRHSRIERGMGLSLLAMVSFMHYRIEHVFVHHKSVATPEDPATARLGESLYAFWLRCLPGTVVSAFEVERHRLTGLRKSVWGIHNRMFQYALIQSGIAALIYWHWGVRGLFLFWMQGLTAVLFLEAIDYLEHYGLLRKKLDSGQYEPVAPRHSWDTDRRFTNWYLFNLGRHSHHHMRPFVEYEALEEREEAPRLPYGYSLMVLLTLVPPLWRRVMDPLCEKL